MRKTVKIKRTRQKSDGNVLGVECFFFHPIYFVFSMYSECFLNKNKKKKLKILPCLFLSRKSTHKQTFFTKKKKKMQSSV